MKGLIVVKSTPRTFKYSQYKKVEKLTSLSKLSGIYRKNWINELDYLI